MRKSKMSWINKQLSRELPIYLRRSVGRIKNRRNPGLKKILKKCLSRWGGSILRLRRALRLREFGRKNLTGKPRIERGWSVIRCVNWLLIRWVRLMGEFRTLEGRRLMDTLRKTRQKILRTRNGPKNSKWSGNTWDKLVTLNQCTKQINLYLC